MDNIEKPAAISGTVTGPFSKDILICQYTTDVYSKGVWLGDNPLHHSSSILMVQIILIFIFTRTIYYFLRSFGQSMISAQILAGIILGPSIMGQIPGVRMKKVFPLESRLILETVSQIGLVLQMFLIGLRMDVSIVKKAGRKAVLIGTAGVIVPYTIGGLAFVSTTHIFTADKTLTNSLPFIAAVNSITSFAVITSLLADLNILNSELGHLAVTTSTIADMWSWSMSAFVTTVGLALRTSQMTALWSIFWMTVFLLAVFCVVRPLIIWIGNLAPEGEPMKEIQVVTILLIVFGGGFCAEYFGQHSAFGALMVGVALPDGPPLGTTLVCKIETIASGLLIPVFFALSGLRVNLLSMGELKSALITEFVIIAGDVGKFTGTILTALYCGVPFWDALALALIMICKGIIEVGTYIMWKDYKIISDQQFSLLILSLLVVTGISRPIIGHLYDPSKRYMAYTRRSILHSRDNVELRILVCIHNEDNVPTMINLLEASNPTRFSAISVCVVHLMELTGRAHAILVPHDDNESKAKFNLTHSEHIVNAFNHYEQEGEGRVMMRHYTAIAPYSSMHNDVCNLALDERTAIVIVPFHKQWTIDGLVGACFPSIRTVNSNVINKAPCSVGVFIDRSQTGGHQSLLSGYSYCIALLFLGGPDDREALAYCKRMAEHQSIRLTVVCLQPRGHYKHYNQKEKHLDGELIADFKANTKGMERIIYKEESVNDGVETTRIIRSMEHAFDLFIVGKHHDPESPVTSGFRDWSECPELGAIGDMLASTDFPFSVLVVQQHPQLKGNN